MLWIALVLFVLWVLGAVGNVGVGIHMLLLAALGFLIVGLMGRAGSSLADEAERTSVERTSAGRSAEVGRGTTRTAGRPNR
ncbi:hypothetical protein [Sinomonas sp. R1AF57]|uniref:hypothetical protein n=1 Tax=Sinomonas sp. R1AF57 TaxID=2020377 RepID=UPI000B5E3F33|nr:hypothetical protein [Sinomonas sp. R1AF57]ASN51044.1 hypothetical protein CGQ25_02265 [Sinomonas sp. R1AF57]